MNLLYCAQHMLGVFMPNPQKNHTIIDSNQYSELSHQVATYPHQICLILVRFTVIITPIFREANIS